MDLVGMGSRCPVCQTPLIVVPDGDLWCAKCHAFPHLPSPGSTQQVLEAGHVRTEAMQHVTQLQALGRPAAAIEFDGTDPNQVFQAMGAAIDFALQLVVKADLLVALEVFKLAADGRVAVVISGEKREGAAGESAAGEPGTPPADQDPPAQPAGS